MTNTARGVSSTVSCTGETNYPLTAEIVQEIFQAWDGQAWQRPSHLLAEHYRLDLYERL